MKVTAKIALLAIVSGLLTFGTGCAQKGLPPGKSPEDVIKDALLSKKVITETVFVMNAKADLKGEVDGEQNTLKGTMDLSGTTNKDAETMQLVFNIDGEMNQESLKVNLEIRANEDGVFMKIDRIEVSDGETQELIELFLEDYLGQWVKLSFITQEDVVESGYAEIDYDENDMFPFKNVEYVGIVDVLGIESYHFTAEVDEDAFLSMVNTGDVAEAKEFFEAAEMYGDVYVAVNEMVLTGFGGNMKLDDPEMNGTVEFTFKVNPTRSDRVDTPSYTQELTEEDIANLMFGGAMMGPGMGEMDMEMMDESMMMEDFDMSEFESMEGMESMEEFDFSTMPIE